MIDPAECRIIGKWRIVEADIWDRDYLDLVDPAFLLISADGHAEFNFGVVRAGGHFEYSATDVFFRWSGSDEGDKISGEATAELQDDGTLELELAFDSGDDAVLTCRRA